MALFEELATQGKTSPEVIFEASTADFAEKIIHASEKLPVIVDFWAPWCGPCKQLTPLLEKLVRDAKGAVLLAKVNIDENKQLAAQLRIQSVPTVMAFFQGQPVDAFMGAKPESQLKAFIKRLIGGKAASPLDDALKMAEEMLQAGRGEEAQDIYQQILTHEPENAEALTALARLFLDKGQVLEAKALLAEIGDETLKEEKIASVIRAIELSEEAAKAGDPAPLQERLSTHPDDHEARYDLAIALIGRGEMDAAVDHLIRIVREDREWQEEAARKKLLEVFEALGPAHPLSQQGRRQLSSVLFS